MSLRTAWTEAVEEARAHGRRAGEGVFLPAPDGGDAWIDTHLPGRADALADALVGRAVRGGSAPSPRELAALDEDLQQLRARVADAQARWTAVRSYAPVRALVARAGTVEDSAHHAQPAEVIAAAARPDVLVFADDNRHVLRALATEGLTLDAVVEDPPYATGSPDLPYRDAFPPGGWEALLSEHLELAHGRLVPHGQLVLHVDEHRVAGLHLAVRARFGDGHLGGAVWDKRNPKGDARGLAMRHEHLVWAVRDRAALWAQGGLWRTKPDALRMLAKAAELRVVHAGDTVAAQVAWRAWLRGEAGLSEGARAYRNLDPDGRVWRPVSMAWPRKTPPPAAYFEPLLHPVTGLPCPVPQRGWRNPPATMARLLAEGRIRFGADHTTQPTRVTHLDEVVRERVPSVIAHAGADDAVQRARGLDFAYAKPVELVRQLLEIAAPAPGARVFDGFAGSGTTAEAARLRTAQGAPLQVVLAEADPAILARALIPRLSAVLAQVRAPPSCSVLVVAPGEAAGWSATAALRASSPTSGSASA